MEQSISTQQLENAYDAYGTAVYRLAMTFLGRYADAEDVTQETFCRLLYHTSAFADENHKKRWLLQLAANLCRNQLRGFWRKRVTQLEEATPSIAPEKLVALNAVIALPEQYKLPIHLHYYERYSVAEIAEILKLGQSAVKIRLKRGRELLKTELDINDYRDVLNEITPNHELKERIMNLKKSQKRYVPIRRIFSVALAAVLVVACLFTVALAASPELRIAVLAFFHIEEKEQIPSTSVPPEEPDISQADIGQMVKVQYIKMDREYGLSGDLLTDLTWSEDDRILLDEKF